MNIANQFEPIKTCDISDIHEIADMKTGRVYLIDRVKGVFAIRTEHGSVLTVEFSEDNTHLYITTDIVNHDINRNNYYIKLMDNITNAMKQYSDKIMHNGLHSITILIPNKSVNKVSIYALMTMSIFTIGIRELDD